MVPLRGNLGRASGRWAGLGVQVIGNTEYTRLRAELAKPYRGNGNDEGGQAKALALPRLARKSVLLTRLGGRGFGPEDDSRAGQIQGECLGDKCRSRPGKILSPYLPTQLFLRLAWRV
ncbi:hypothetical protein CCM_03380 [Cordyceps militaris CM01]|uniref:Uncharacterized protein n=1 Tax=Cordyceps militaris (strain CM01) TaxID=983644 RepID=G3JAE0_CORMM|nr:uncharacterized protein CCM_03380 [Cordyceps militaris CM01]EGX95108.1 hypothetical protein CCM_03380 [Cordyceps militaris CM01]